MDLSDGTLGSAKVHAGPIWGLLRPGRTPAARSAHNDTDGVRNDTDGVPSRKNGAGRGGEPRPGLTGLSSVVLRQGRAGDDTYGMNG